MIVTLEREPIFQENYVSLDEFKRLHDDFIDFKRYVAEVLNIVSNFKRVSANHICSEPSITDPSNLTPTNLKDENVAALRSEIKDLKEQNKTCLKIIETLSENIKIIHEEKKTPPHGQKKSLPSDIIFKNTPNELNNTSDNEISNNVNNGNDRKGKRPQQVVPGNTSFANG